MSLNDLPINWSEFYKAYTGVKFTIKQNGCKVFLPNYANILHSHTIRTSGGETQTLATSGTAMAFQDEFSTKSFLVAGEPERLNKVFLKDLWEYPENNVKWDDFNEILSLEDVDVEEVSLADFAQDVDSFLVFQKLAKFGDVWWTTSVQTSLEGSETAFANIEVPNVSGSGVTATQKIEFWSPDKYVNDEYKKFVSDPSSYTGFLTSDDFQTGGWFSIPDLQISSQPFEKLKIASTLLNLNFTFDPNPHFGNFYSVESTIAARIKDSTSNVVLDSSQSKNSQNIGHYADTLIANWVGGLVSTDNISEIGEVGAYQQDSCAVKRQEINNEEVETNNNQLSHLFNAQISLKPDYSSDQRDFLGTIDPINWKSANTTQTENPHSIGALNVDRAFGGASGDIENGLVVGGINTSSNGVPTVLDTSEVWQNDTFVKSLLITTNSPRCFHVQGGTGSSSCAVVGGYSAMNTTNVQQFSDYGKTNVLSGMEYYVQTEEPELSFFRKISDYSMIVPRGEGAGTLQVTTNTRQDKFQVEDIIGSYNLTPDDDQKILEFVDDASTNIINDVPVPSNFRRYNVTNIEGFVVAGNTTGNVYLLNSPSSNDIIDTYESINTTHVDVSQNVAVTTTLSEEIEQSIEEILDSVIVDSAESTVDDVVTIGGSSETGQEVQLAECGKYRLEYINGAFKLQDSNENQIIDSVISIDSTDSDGETVTLPYCGKYRLKYLEGDYRTTGTSTIGFSTSFTVFGNQQDGTSISIDKCGIYQFEILSGAVEYTNESDTSVSVNRRWGTAIEARINGSGGWTSLISSDTGTLDPASSFAAVAGETANFCVNGLGTNPSISNTIDIRFDEDSMSPFSDGSWSNNEGSMVVKVTYFGPTGGCLGCGATQLNVEVNNISEGSAFVGNTDDYDFCSPYYNSDLKLYVPSGTDGHVNVRLIYLGAGDCDCSTTPTSSNIYNSHMNVYVNEQLVGNAFDSGFQESTQAVELYNQARPTRLVYDFCSTEPNSTVRMSVLDENDNDLTNNEGYVNLRVLYLGTADCDCSTSTSTPTTTTETIEETIIHSSSDPTKAYPVRCHGLAYVGSKESGLATGGRTEYNTIDNVECRLKERYGLIGKNSCANPISSNELEQHRVLDLAYEFNGSTWIRRQNLFESVYYHTGVGDASHALFWGGLHDTLSQFEFNFNVNSTDANTIPISAFDCESEKNIEEEESDNYGEDYVSIPEIESGPCWYEPTWQSAALSGFGIIDDPRFQSGEGTLAVALDPDFPDVYVTSVGPTNPVSVTTQDVSSVTYDVVSVSRLEVDKTFTSGEAEFQAEGFILNSNGTLSSTEIAGTFFLSSIDSLNISSTDDDFYPSASYIGDSFTFEITDVKVIAGGEVIIYYSLSHTGPGNFIFQGFGQMLFDSMQDIWLALVAGNGTAQLTATNNVFTIQASSVIEDNGGELGNTIQGSATVTFGITPDTGILVGVNNLDQEWNAQSSQCGPSISDFISLTVSIDPGLQQRWGLPMWVGGVVEEVPGIFALNYDYTSSSENISGDVGLIEHETTQITMGASNVGSIINDRVLLSGSTKRQTHLYTAVGTADLTGVSASPACATMSGSSSTSLPDTSASGLSYAEWGTAFIQEYRDDQRFSLPEQFVPSNGQAIRGSNNPLTSKPSYWKRFMDGVGLGGDAPDYTTIVDLNGNQKAVNKWQGLNSYYVGQMAFGTTERAIIVGGHRINPNLEAVGLHASPTSNRIFVWDFVNIPPEDTYLTNYLGRRFWNYYVNDSGLLIPTQTQSTFSVKVFEAESEIVVERIGTAYFDGSSDNVSITLDKEMPEEVGTNYSISLQPSDNVKVWWSDKEAGGFTINVEAETWEGQVDYIASTTIKVTEEDIDDLGPLDGYIINK